MRKNLPILLLALTILVQDFTPVAYAASKNEVQFQTVYFCPSDATSEGAGNALISVDDIIIKYGTRITSRNAGS